MPIAQRPVPRGPPVIMLGSFLVVLALIALSIATPALFAGGLFAVLVLSASRLAGWQRGLAGRAPAILRN